MDVVDGHGPSKEGWEGWEERDLMGTSVSEASSRIRELLPDLYTAATEVRTKPFD